MHRWLICQIGFVISDWFASGRRLLKSLCLVVRNHRCDKKLRIDTGRESRFLKLYEDVSFHRDSHGYVPTPYSSIEKMIQCLKLDERDVFADLGSGKGRVVLSVAMQKLKKVIGVEIQEKLIEVARNNAERLDLKTPVEFVHADIFNFMPNGVTVYFMYHPFDYKTTAGAIDAIQKSLREDPRTVRIVRYGGILRGLFDSQDWLDSCGGINGPDFFIWTSKNL